MNISLPEPKPEPEPEREREPEPEPKHAMVLSLRGRLRLLGGQLRRKVVHVTATAHKHDKDGEEAQLDEDGKKAESNQDGEKATPQQDDKAQLATATLHQHVEETLAKAHQSVSDAVEKIKLRTAEAAHAWSDWKDLDDASRMRLARTILASSHDGEEAPPEPELPFTVCPVV